MAEQTKVCLKCEQDKELSEYHKCSKKADGYNYYCKLCMREINKASYKINATAHNERVKEYRQNNKEYFTEVARIYQKQKYHSNINFRIEDILRSRFYKAIKGNKSKSIIKLIGCTTDELKQYLESLFLPEMTWDNQNIVWEIDHIKPCASFDLTDLEQQKVCFHFSNLQPLFKTTAIAEQHGYNDHVGNRNKYNKTI